MTNSAYTEIYKNPMEPVVEMSEDVHVRTYIAYGDSDDHKLYVDPECETQIAQADAFHAFERGALMIEVDDVFLIPLAMDEHEVITLDEGLSDASIVRWATVASE